VDLFANIGHCIVDAKDLFINIFRQVYLIYFINIFIILINSFLHYRIIISSPHSIILINFNNLYFIIYYYWEALFDLNIFIVIF